MEEWIEPASSNLSLLLIEHMNILKRKYLTGLSLEIKGGHRQSLTLDALHRIQAKFILSISIILQR